MNRTVFTNNVVIADLDLGFSFRRKRKILRRRANNRAVSDKIVGAHRYIAFNDHVRLHDRFIADYHLSPAHQQRTALPPPRPSRPLPPPPHPLPLPNTPLPHTLHSLRPPLHHPPILYTLRTI